MLPLKQQMSAGVPVGLETGQALAVERRGMPRFPILQRCFVWPGTRSSDPAAPPGWRCIAYNISATGVAVALPLPIQPGRVLEIEPWQLPGVGLLRATVVRISPVQYVWFCGCEWIEPLNNASLQAWITGPRADIGLLLSRYSESGWE